MTKEQELLELQVRGYLILLGNTPTLYGIIKEVEERFPKMEEAGSFVLKCYREDCFCWAGLYYSQV